MSGFTTCLYNDKEMEYFYSVFRDFSRGIGCFYLCYVFESLIDGRRYGFSTHPDWQEHYLVEGLIDHCHLKKGVVEYFVNTEKQNLILPWEHLFPKSSIQKDIILYREEMEIGSDGVSFCDRGLGYREYFALAPMVNEKGFLQRLLPQIDLVKLHLSVFRETSIKNLSKFY